MPPVTQATVGGGRLELRDGMAFHRAVPNDIEAVLGVTLERSAEGLVVASVRSEDSQFRVRDVITSVTPVYPVRVKDKREPQPKAGPSLESLDLEDLRRYCVGVNWLTLQLDVVRGEETLQVFQPVGRPDEQIPVERYDPRHTFRRNGFEMCEITEWADAHRPTHAGTAEGLRTFMVTRVETSSGAAQAGLRPMDILVSTPDGATIDNFELTGKGVFVHVGGEAAEIVLPPNREPTDILLPLLFSYESDELGEHLGVGPFDALFHYSAERIYDYRTGAFGAGSRWSLLTTFWYNDTTETSGDRVTFGSEVVDSARLTYFILWLARRGNVDVSRHWEGS